MASSKDLNISRAVALATEICEVLEWRDDECQPVNGEPDLSPESVATAAPFLLKDRVETLCWYLDDLGMKADALSIRACIDDLRERVRIPTWDLSQEQQDYCDSLIVEAARDLREYVMSVKHTLAEQLRRADQTGNSGDATPPVDDSDWPTVGDAASEQGVTSDVITKAANKGELATNGKTGRPRRIDPKSLVAWSLKRARRD